MKCECEHIAHFDDRATADHKYGSDELDVKKVRLVGMGEWNLCKPCRENCQHFEETSV